MLLELQTGRPASDAGRMEKEIRVYDLLDSLQIDYQRVDHEAAMGHRPIVVQLEVTD